MIAVVTGSSGLVGSEAVKYFTELGFDVLGFDNNMRAEFFGPEASTSAVGENLLRKYNTFRHFNIDIRDFDRIEQKFSIFGDRIDLVVHCAAQPAHDWAAKAPLIDFGVNAQGTLNVIEATRRHCPDAPFVHCSTSKVYGDNPNGVELCELPTRLHPFGGSRWEQGFDTSLSIDQCTHSLFGASKAAADLIVQEYGNYFGMPTVCFRPGCITGPRHAGAELHGFLAYLMKCTMTGKEYTVFGYSGKQVRCNIHALDLVKAFDVWRREPCPGDVYNIGGGPQSNCSMMEAIDICQFVANRQLKWNYKPKARIGDHKWWVSDNVPFEKNHSSWKPKYTTRSILEEMYEENRELWV